MPSPREQAQCHCPQMSHRLVLRLLAGRAITGRISHDGARSGASHHMRNCCMDGSIESFGRIRCRRLPAFVRGGAVHRSMRCCGQWFVEVPVLGASPCTCLHRRCNPVDWRCDQAPQRSACLPRLVVHAASSLFCFFRARCWPCGA
jgi:hypothetical protein